MDSTLEDAVRERAADAPPFCLSRARSGVDIR
jgi:hypothetical protein